MLVDLLKQHKTISLIGMAKNVGKTTTLNHLINAFNKAGTSLALTSIGRDGESTDIVTQTNKPQIYVHNNTVIATAEKLLNLCDITKEILHVTDINTPLGRVVVAKAKSAGFVQLGGPSITSQVSQLLSLITQDKAIVDGALSRKTIANPSVTDATILCTGASLNSNINLVLEQTRHTVDMLMLPRYNKDIKIDKDQKITKSDDTIYISGAVSDMLLNEIVLSTKTKAVTIVAEDPSKIFIKSGTYQKLKIKELNLAVQNSINLVALTVNPVSAYGYSFSKQELLQRVQDVVPIPVFDIGE